MILRQIGREFCLAANLDLVDRDGYEFVAYTQEASDREDYRRHGCRVEIHQNIFDLANGGIILVNLAANEFARPRALAPCCIIEARYRRRDRCHISLRLLSLSRGKSEENWACRKVFPRPICRGIALCGTRTNAIMGGNPVA